MPTPSLTSSPSSFPTGSHAVRRTVSEKVAAGAAVVVGGLLTTVVTQATLRLAWRFVTGPRPPGTRHRAASFGAVLAWVVGGGAGAGVAKVLNDRRTTSAAVLERTH
jgi:uncharacterized protein DUF4235